MLTPGLTNTPLTKFLLIYTVASSVLLSILDSKHLAHIYVSPHFWQWGQFWRGVVWQAAGFANSTEALFGGLLVYHLRVIERGWGVRKAVSFLLSTLLYTTLLTPIILSLVLRPLSLNYLNYLPSGPTPIIFALLAQYHASIPHVFRYRISTSRSDTTTNTNNNTQNTTNSTNKKSLTLLLSDKSTTYLIAAQLALSQFPGMLLPAAIGWIVGLAWRAELLPLVSFSWSDPAWVVGERERERVRSRGRGRVSGEGVGGFGATTTTTTSESGIVGDGDGDGDGRYYDDLRRRLEGEAVAAAAASGAGGIGGIGGVEQQEQRQRRTGTGTGTGSRGLLERFRGAF